MKKIFLLIISMTVLWGCRNENVITIKGKVREDLPVREFITINSMDINSTAFIDSTRISRKGTFKFRVKSAVPEFYQIAFSPSNFITLLAEPGEDIILEFENRNLYEKYSVAGSSGSDLVKMLDDRLLVTKRKLDSLNAIYDKASAEPGFEDIEPILEKELADLVRAQRRNNIEFVVTNISSLASIKALFQKLNDQAYVLYNPRDLQYLKIVSDSLKKKYPDSRHTKALVSTFENEMAEFNKMRLLAMMDTLPEVKLDAVLSDMSGKQIALSSLRGKYVLLAFWSAASRECIAENIQLKEFYRLYNKRGFEIYQVNLDADEEMWKSAVRFDELPWISVREEDPSNPGTAILFNVKNLPANFLFDPQGNIIASELHGRNLQVKLTQLFNN